ncbi:phosphoesterase [Hahella sp. CCB-MM4]|uniref:phosphoesterase n=1 Tax=Hahella sp. (strain CCB-MM4) TaxID=1926491 RepID=UPI001FF01A70|nr:phosphoesterase [Hahella sp. CCB-MM4]
MVIYHGGGCLDGFGSALAAYCYLNCREGLEVEYYAAQHNEPPPNVMDREVYLLDFCYPRATMQTLCEAASKVTILDHHISAYQDCKGLDQDFPHLEMVFDMNRSGAVITWEYFHREPVPRLLQCIQDRDLWSWTIPESRDVTAALASYPQEFDVWLPWLDELPLLEDLAREGKVINRYRNLEIIQYKKRAAMGRIAGFDVPIVNCPTNIISEVLGELAQGYPFAAGYLDKPEKRIWSLRSSAEGEDVSQIASLFGGGGHARASGFSTPLSASTRRLNNADLANTGT